MSEKGYGGEPVRLSMRDRTRHRSAVPVWFHSYTDIYDFEYKKVSQKYGYVGSLIGGGAHGQ